MPATAVLVRTGHAKGWSDRDPRVGGGVVDSGKGLGHRGRGRSAEGCGGRYINGHSGTAQCIVDPAAQPSSSCDTLTVLLRPPTAPPPTTPQVPGQRPTAAAVFATSLRFPRQVYTRGKY